MAQNGRNVQVLADLLQHEINLSYKSQSQTDMWVTLDTCVLLESTPSHYLFQTFELQFLLDVRVTTFSTNAWQDLECEL